MIDKVSSRRDLGSDIFNLALYPLARETRHPVIRHLLAQSEKTEIVYLGNQFDYFILKHFLCGNEQHQLNAVLSEGILAARPHTKHRKQTSFADFNIELKPYHNPNQVIEHLGKR